VIPQFIITVEMANKKAKSDSKRKDTIHSRFKLVTVTDTDGSTFKLYSTLKKDAYTMDVGPKVHSAWTKDLSFVTKSSAAQSFKDKYGDLM